jgi:hypothetical protein
MPTTAKRICLTCGADKPEFVSMLNEPDVLVWNPNTGGGVPKDCCYKIRTIRE